MAIALPADDCFEFLWPWGPRHYPLTTLSLFLWLLLTKLSLIYGHQTKYRKSSFNIKCFSKALHTDALVRSSLRNLGSQLAVSLRIPKRSCKIVEMPPCDTRIHLSGYTRFRIFLHISSSVASSRRPDLD